MSEEKSDKSKKISDKISENLSSDQLEDNENECSEELVNASAEVLQLYNEILKSYNTALTLMDIAMSQLSIDKKHRKFNRSELAGVLCVFNAIFENSLNLMGELKSKLHKTYLENENVQDFKQAV